MNNKKIGQLWQMIIKELGDNPQREGLKATPRRISKMYNEIFRGYKKKNRGSIKTFKNESDNNGKPHHEMICDTGYFYSLCEHHVVPFFGEYYFGYIPDKRIIGLSKVGRLIDFHSARLQVQERLTKQIVDDIDESIMPLGVILILKGRHLCKEMRGIKKVNGNMITTCARGSFKNNKDNKKKEFMRLVGL